jgi:hypothetical protein
MERKKSESHAVMPAVERFGVEMAKRAARAGPSKPAGLILCLSSVRSGPKRVGSVCLARKKQVESGLSGPKSTF